MVTSRRPVAAAPARRTPAARTPAARAPAAAPRSSGYRGAAGLQKMQEEEERAAARKEAQSQMSGMPFRFFCPVGETREIVVIDEKPDFFRYEHNLKNPQSGKWDIFTACINEHANCPVCKHSERGAYFAMYLTVIDLTPYVNRDDIEVPWSKKLLVVKPQQQKKLMRIYEREGTLRGVILAMTRDGDKDASIGNDIEVAGSLDEDELAEYVDVYVDKKNVEHEVIGGEIFDYDELFPEPTEESLRAIVGGAPEPGSRDSDRRAHRGDDWGGDAGDRPAVRRRPGTAAAAPAPAARGPVRRSAVRDPDPVDEEQQQEEEAAPVSRAPVRRALPARSAPARRDADVEDAPQRGAAPSLADRRRALRR